MDVRQFQVTISCADPAALSRFWCEVLGYELDPPPPGFASWEEALEKLGVPVEQRNSSSACHDPHDLGPRLFFQQVPAAAVTTNNLHLDVRAAPDLGPEERMAAFEVECERLVALGATRVRRHEPDPPLSLGWIVMTDPEGNEFCLD